ncbi:unnamed protein product [Bursaphelenchus xylophilus]|uniref:(pine wood nematode) hypothetical protein n=1 Tax=Bursaphelenchus xylophilus TaxID=6326 RepID=A0A1I7SGW0_BURXY|nr:unnamed protein product [Bursaphelenchus xylophilus]CAG9100389.1 unnamed protein product [Bursaphelenchus xylophilus]
MIPEQSLSFIMNRPLYTIKEADPVDLCRWAAEEFRQFRTARALAKDVASFAKDRSFRRDKPTTSQPVRSNPGLAPPVKGNDNVKGSEQTHRKPGPSQKLRYPCAFCQEDHRTATCRANVDLQTRKSRATAAGLCNTCLRRKHDGKCNLFPCRRCSQLHHSVFCHLPAPPENQGEERKQMQKPSQPGAYITLGGDPVIMPTHRKSMLPTLQAKLKAKTNTSKPVELLVALDSHAHFNFITTDAAKKLGLRLSDPITTTIHGFGANTTTRAMCVTEAFVELNDGSLHPVTLWVTDQFIKPYPVLNGLPQTEESLLRFKLPNPIPLKEPDVLFGINEVTEFQTTFTTLTHPSNLRVVRSRIGLTLSGTIISPFPSEITALLTLVETPPDMDVEDAWFNQLCSVQHLGIHEKDFFHTEEDEVVKKFHQTMKRDSEGRFQVYYPIKDSIRELQSHFSVALARLKSFQQKMVKHPEIWKTILETVHSIPNFFRRRSVSKKMKN